MIKGFFLDGIQVNGAGIAVDETVEFTTTVLSDPAEAALPFFHTTGAGAEFAADRTAIERGIIAGKFSPYESPVCDLGMCGSERYKKGCTREKTQSCTTKV